MSREVIPPSGSEFLRVNGLRVHVRRFGAAESIPLFVLHGWMDASASFVPLIDRLLFHFPGRLQVIAPDWRGHGYSEWAKSGYRIADYVADLDTLMGYYAANQPSIVIGHSMGANIAALYAGLYPKRIMGLACLDGFNLPDMSPQKAPSRYRNWLAQTKNLPRNRVYPDFEALALRIARHHPRLSIEMTRHVARCWAAENGAGQVRLLADPQHRLRGPNLYRVAEAKAIWRLVRARTLLLQSGESEHHGAITAVERRRRHACFRDRCVEEFPGVGHLLHFEDPQGVAHRMANFLKEILK